MRSKSLVPEREGELISQKELVVGSTVTRLLPIRVEIKELDHLAIVASLWDDLGFTEVLDRAIPADPQVELTPGVVIKALVLNLVCGRDALYRVEEFFRRCPIDALLGRQVQPSNLNDSSLARHLDRLFDAGGEKVFNALSLQAIRKEELSFDPLHADTTSRIVFGEFVRSDGNDAVSITRGYSKDHRPDLKQVMMGIGVNGEGIPLMAQMLDGNQSDKTWHGQFLDIVKTRLSLKRETPLRYVGDSALMTQENLELAERHNIVIISRLPRTVGACDELVNEALGRSTEWEEIGTVSPRKDAAVYRAQSFRREVLGSAMQLVVYQTTAVDQRSEHTGERRQEKNLVKAKKAARQLGKRVFTCEPDAQAELDRFTQTHEGMMLDIRAEVVTRMVPAKILRPRGRPKKSTGIIHEAVPAWDRAVVVCQEILKSQTNGLATCAGALGTTLSILAGSWITPKSTERPAKQVTLLIAVEKDLEALKKAQEEAGCFVIVNTAAHDLGCRKLLELYKGQSAAEMRFPFLKSPEWADVFFVKHPERVEALGYVFMIGLLVWSLWERRVRSNLRDSGEPPIKDTTGFKKANPTAAVCVHVMRGLKLIRLRRGEDTGEWQLAEPLSEEQARVVRFSATTPRSQTPILESKNRPLLDGG
jgi:transposase